MGYTVKYKKVYDQAEADDGARILVDPVLPKDTTNCNLGLDEWYSKVAPSMALRHSLRKEEIDFEDFLQRYRDELEQSPNILTPLVKHARKQGLTLLSAMSDLSNSHLPILRQCILSALALEDSQADDNAPSSPTCYQP